MENQITPDILYRTEQLQDEMLAAIDELKLNYPFSKCSHDDLCHVFTLMKIAELQLKQDSFKRCNGHCNTQPT